MPSFFEAARSSPAAEAAARSATVQSAKRCGSLLAGPLSAGLVPGGRDRIMISIPIYRRGPGRLIRGREEFFEISVPRNWRAFQYRRRLFRETGVTTSGGDITGSVQVDRTSRALWFFQVEQ